VRSGPKQLDSFSQVKRLDWRSSNQRKFGERSWFVELAALSNARHRNLVQLLGFCIEGEERLLVLEFFPDGSLSKRLHAARGGAPFLSWEERMSVIEGVCRGLAYLHHDIHPPLLHRDIKAANILLRGSEACIGDFGLAHLMQDADSVGDTTSVIKGTLPYMAPEYLQGGSKFLSTKCDVYAFGVLVLELLSGRACTSVGSGGRTEPLVSSATRLVQDGRGLEVIDPAVWDAFRVPEAECCLQIAVECLQSEPEDRPSMERVNFRLRVLRSETSASQAGPFDSVYGLSGSESPSTILHGLREEPTRNSVAGRLQPIESFVEPYNFVTAR
jgi:serine/threonine protein kinase